MVSRIFIYVEAEREVGELDWERGEAASSQSLCVFAYGLLFILCSISKSPDSSHLSSGLEYFHSIYPPFFSLSADAACSDLLIKAVQPELNSNSIMRE